VDNIDIIEKREYDNNNYEQIVIKLKLIDIINNYRKVKYEEEKD